MNRTHGQLLDEALEAAMVAGEGPYQANRKAVRSLNILNRAPEGREDLEEVLRGLGGFIQTLERLRNVSQNVIRDVVATLR